MKSLKEFSNNALVAPNKVMGGAPNVGDTLNEVPEPQRLTTGVYIDGVKQLAWDNDN